MVKTNRSAEEGKPLIYAHFPHQMLLNSSACNMLSDTRVWFPEGRHLMGVARNLEGGRVLRSFWEEKKIPQDLISDECKHGHGGKAQTSSPET